MRPRPPLSSDVVCVAFFLSGSGGRASSRWDELGRVGMTRRGGGVDEASSPRRDHGANNAWVLHMPAALSSFYSSLPGPAATRDWSIAGMCC